MPFAFVATAATAAGAQGKITTPKEFFGHNIGDDYFLANYDQFMAYWHKLDAESNRMQVFEMGKSSEGRPQLAAIITSPENFKLLQKYKDISMKLANGEGLTDAQAHALAKEGKAVVWFDGGLHATEVLGANRSLIETSTSCSAGPTTRRCGFSKTTSSLAVHANPDGMELVADWYMKDKDTLQAEHEHSAPLQEVRGPRRQPRLVHVQPVRDQEHQSSDVRGLASGRSCTTITRRVRPAR